MTYLFVYGTLMRGQRNEGYLMDLPCWPATTRGHLFHVPAGYPALVPDAAGAEITGEVMRLEDLTRLRILDLLEGVPDGLFRRVRLPVRSMDRPGEAWAWTIDAKTAKRRRYRPLRTSSWRRMGRA
jgi:gamma-glutamylcyclotransferase (GGCT)/AIG2-like uncharacterized protein YtfP